MTITTALVDYLLSLSGLTNLIGQRLSPFSEGQESALPRVTYEVQSQKDFDSLSGASGLKQTQILLRCVDEDYDGAKALAEAIAGTSSAEKLHGFGPASMGTAPGVWVQRVRVDQSSDDRETIRAGQEKGEYLVELTVTLWHTGT